MGPGIFITVLMLMSFVQLAIMPFTYGVDLLLIAAIFISLSGRRERGVLPVWILGLLRGMLSSRLDGYPVFYPLFFVVMFAGLGLIRERVKAEHPLTQFVIVGAVSLVYGFADVLLTTGLPFAHRLFRFWDNIIILAFINAVCGILLLRLFQLIPRRGGLVPEHADF